MSRTDLVDQRRKDALVEVLDTLAGLGVTTDNLTHAAAEPHLSTTDTLVAALEGFATVLADHEARIDTLEP